MILELIQDPPMLRLLPLVLGAFAIGAETFLVSSVLPQIAADLHVTAAAAGSLVTIFALAYAFGSPLIAVATAGVERKRLLIVAIAAFALANLVAAVAPNFSASPRRARCSRLPPARSCRPRSPSPPRSLPPSGAAGRSR